MPTGTITPERPVSQTVLATSPVADDEDVLRAAAIEQLERVRKLKMHAVLFPFGIVALGIVWVLTEYFDDHSWPTRFADADNGVPGTWNPWYFWAVGIWSAVLLVHAAKAYAGRYGPPTKQQIDREVERLRSRR